MSRRARTVAAICIVLIGAACGVDEESCGIPIGPALEIGERVDVEFVVTDGRWPMVAIGDRVWDISSDVNSTLIASDEVGERVVVGTATLTAPEHLTVELEGFGTFEMNAEDHAIGCD